MNNFAVDDFPNPDIMQCYYNREELEFLDEESVLLWEYLYVEERNDYYMNRVPHQDQQISDFIQHLQNPGYEEWYHLFYLLVFSALITTIGAILTDNFERDVNLLIYQPNQARDDIFGLLGLLDGIIEGMTGEERLHHNLDIAVVNEIREEWVDMDVNQEKVAEEESDEDSDEENVEEVDEENDYAVDDFPDPDIMPLYYIMEDLVLLDEESMLLWEYLCIVERDNYYMNRVPHQDQQISDFIQHLQNPGYEEWYHLFYLLVFSALILQIEATLNDIFERDLDLLLYQPNQARDDIFGLLGLLDGIIEGMTGQQRLDHNLDIAVVNEIRQEFVDGNQEEDEENDEEMDEDLEEESDEEIDEEIGEDFGEFGDNEE